MIAPIVREYPFAHIKIDKGSVEVIVLDSLYYTFTPKMPVENLRITLFSDNHFCLECDQVLWDYFVEWIQTEKYSIHKPELYREDWMEFTEEKLSLFQRLKGKKPEKLWFAHSKYEGRVPLKATEPFVCEVFGTLTIKDRR